MVRELLAVARRVAGAVLQEAGRRVAGRMAPDPLIEENTPPEERELTRLSTFVAMTPKARAMVEAGLQPPRHPRRDPHTPEPPLRGSAAAQRRAAR
jgi:hypothetical protein